MSAAGNFRPRPRSNRAVTSAWLLPVPLRRVLARARAAVARRLEGAPILFLAVVIGVALTFRVALGWARAPAEPPTAEPSPRAAPHAIVRAGPEAAPARESAAMPVLSPADDPTLRPAPKPTRARPRVRRAPRGAR